MLTNLRNALMTGKRLPYDAEVEFLESTGTQYINTGIKPGPNTSVEITFAMTTFTANCGLFGARDISSANLYYNLFIINNQGHRVRWDWCGKGDYKTSEAETSTAATYVLGAAGGDITRDGVSLMSVSSTKTALNQPLYIFNFNNNGSPYSTGANARFWSVKIYDGQTLVFDGIPVRKGTTGELYDRVSGKFAERHGDFVVGQDVVPVEYLQSSGTQWIDTGVVPAANDTFTVKTRKNNASQDNASFGLAAVVYCFANSTGTFWCHPALGAGGRTGVNPLGDTNWHTIVASPASVSVDGAVLGDRTSDAQSPLSTVKLFARGNNSASGGVAKQYNGMISHAFINRGGSDLRKFYAVRVGTDATSWEGAMMDTLTRRIYRNAGTGAFTYGNDLKYPIPAS